MGSRLLSPCPAGLVNMGIHNLHMFGQRLNAGEWLLGIHSTSHYLVPRIVNRILVTVKIVRAREVRVARSAGAWIYALTLVSSARISKSILYFRSWLH
jgi:hypothetical protein